MCRKLKSASAACDLMMSISKMAGGTDDSMHRQIMGKLDSILHQFSREMHAAADVFHSQKVSLWFLSAQETLSHLFRLIPFPSKHVQQMQPRQICE